ncbi:hypothetical protein [Thermomonas sp.]|uniref:hypothetical protein n=1 Tax=Thermomonas sp. TaxID=1971895 RepID=UPI0024876094|nr:hypothetical protein [Thermomonas sp.]MDI1252911.1 hypothetical protein [Thermomonas sp.]
MSSRTPVLQAILAAAVLLLVVPCVHAQDASPEMVIPQENVRYDYAQVLDVDPVYQILRTSRMEQVCDVTRQPSSGTGLSRVVGAVKQRLGVGSSGGDDDGVENCRMQPVVREFRRPIAYDVDYDYKGSKFRTRMARDPGNRLRVRVSITPQPSQDR